MANKYGNIKTIHDAKPKFVERESYKHKMAKEVLREWFYGGQTIGDIYFTPDRKCGVWFEYPIVATAKYNSVRLNWDRLLERNTNRKERNTDKKVTYNRQNELETLEKYASMPISKPNTANAKSWFSVVKSFFYSDRPANKPDNIPNNTTDFNDTPEIKIDDSYEIIESYANQTVIPAINNISNVNEAGKANNTDTPQDLGKDNICLLDEYVPKFDELIKLGIYPKRVIDVVLTHKGKPLWFIEICHKNPTSQEKITELKSMGVRNLIEIDAEWILSQIKRPERIKYKRLI
jgi:hypothetical protein